MRRRSRGVRAACGECGTEVHTKKAGYHAVVVPAEEYAPSSPPLLQHAKEATHTLAERWRNRLSVGNTSDGVQEPLVVLRRRSRV